jgi:hypothetical protein
MASTVFEPEARAADGRVYLPEFAPRVTRPTLDTYVQANKPLKSIAFCFP